MLIRAEIDGIYELRLPGAAHGNEIMPKSLA